MVKLLLVDDEQIIREGICRMIDWEKLGITLAGAFASATEALELMMDVRPDILLTDVRMPGMDGLELIERATKLHPQLQCIVLSGYDEFAYAQRALRAGVAEYLLKPCAREEMEEALQRACARVRERNQKRAESFKERQGQVKGLVARLENIEPGEDGIITVEKVHDVCREYEDPSLLRDALMKMLMQSEFGKKYGEWSFNAVQNAYVQPELLEELTAEILTRLSSGREEKRAFVRRMIDYVQNHFDFENLSLQYIADEVLYMNVDYIGREFARAMDMKFSAYLLSVRMDHAKALMAGDPTLHSYEVAERIGMGSNPRYFSQVFKKNTGFTPKEYKKQAREESKTEN